MSRHSFCLAADAGITVDHLAFHFAGSMRVCSVGMYMLEILLVKMIGSFALFLFAILDLISSGECTQDREDRQDDVRHDSLPLSLHEGRVAEGGIWNDVVG